MTDSIQTVRRPRKTLWGLFVRREAWVISRGGRLAILIGLVAGLVTLMKGAYPFLAVNNGGSGDVLVVEGWISTRRTEQAAKTFQGGRYQSVVVVRDLYSDGDKWSSGRHTADYIAGDLTQRGVPENLVHTLFCPVVRRDRTYHCALAVREWLRQERLRIRSLDVATMATHTRRSRLLYEKAFGQSVAVGAIALEDPSYDPVRWWGSSAGVRDVLGETIAYVYAKLFFWPDTNEILPKQEEAAAGSW